jgi:flagellar hook-basal body complex protein FliE
MSVGPVAQAALNLGVAGSAAAGGSSAGQTFAQILSGAVSQVVGAQATATQLAATYAMGGNVTLEQVMLATSKAELLVETAGAVTTRAISAYQSLMQTSIG